MNLAYGTINYFKKIEIPEGLIQCRGDLNFLEDYPTLIFDCFLISNNKGKLFKEFSIKTKSKNKNIKLNFSGNFSLTNQKINFKKISMNDSYTASKEDLIYFKESFENILIDGNFLKNFNLKKFKMFIKEIS